MLWHNVKQILTEKLPENVVSLWIDPLECVQENDETLELTGPDRFFCSWVAENYLPVIKEALCDLGKKETLVRFAGWQPPFNTGGAGGEKKSLAQLRLPHMPERRVSLRTLHPRYTFDEFMVGDSNALAHSACKALADGDNTLGPCLYIDAGTGLGKSHLSHAVGHYVSNTAPGTRLHFITAQQLTAEIVRNIKNNTMEQFKDKYQNNCDFLLVEDVQSLAGRTKTQIELAEVLDALMDCGKTIIFTGAVAPRKIPDMDEGVRSRLSAGLITTINPPDPMTRRRIIERKAKYNNLSLSEELIIYMAENIRGDIRQVESAVVGLKAKCSLLKMQPDLTMVKEVIANIVGRQPALTSVVIRDFVAGQYKIAVSDLQSKSRKRSIAFPRQVSMYLARKLTEQPLSEIGKAFNRDHSTVVHSIRTINDAIARNGSIRGQIDLLSEKLKEQYS